MSASGRRFISIMGEQDPAQIDQQIPIIVIPEIAQAIIRDLIQARCRVLNYQFAHNAL